MDDKREEELKDSHTCSDSGGSLPCPATAGSSAVFGASPHLSSGSAPSYSLSYLLCAYCFCSFLLSLSSVANFFFPFFEHQPPLSCSQYVSAVSRGHKFKQFQLKTRISDSGHPSRSPCSRTWVQKIARPQALISEDTRSVGGTSSSLPCR